MDAPIIFSQIDALLSPSGLRYKAFLLILVKSKPRRLVISSLGAQSLARQIPVVTPQGERLHRG